MLASNISMFDVLRISLGPPIGRAGWARGWLIASSAVARTCLLNTDSALCLPSTYHQVPDQSMTIKKLDKRTDFYKSYE